MSEAASTLICPHADVCTVCNWIGFNSQEQKTKKLQALKDVLLSSGLKIPSDVDFHTAGLEGIRDRVDLTYHQGRYGFFKKDSREIFDLLECPLMSPELFRFYQEIRKVQIPINKGSLRLRVSPQGLRGVWLDFANEDIRDLLQERKALQALLDLGFVEIGQRRKKLSENFKLVDPEFHPWTQTWSGDMNVLLEGLVGSFSQSGDLANKVLVREMQMLFEKATSQRWVEFGAGSGNLTFPLAGRSRQVTALEFDALALQGLQSTLQKYPDFQNRIQCHLGDYQRKAQYGFQKEEGVLVNPPRSGLQKFLDPLFETPSAQRPRDFVYMSCYLESFCTDAKRLRDLGYQLRDLKIVDQFPNSPHFEILSRWELN